MDNRLLQQLEMVERLAKSGTIGLSAARLCEDAGISLATLKRYLAELRHLGARIEAYGGGCGPWHYRLRNWQQIEKTVTAWLRLERARSLTELDCG